MFKPNTVIVLAYNQKENKVYMIDVTSKKIYSSFCDFRIVNSNEYYGIGVVLIGAFSRFIADISPGLYLDTSSQHLKVPLMLVVILIGFIIFGLASWKSYGLQLEEYLQQLPQPKEVNNIEEVLDKGHSRALLGVFLILGFLFASIYMFNQFFNDRNLISYLWAFVWSLLFFSSSALLKGVIFAFKIAAEMNPKTIIYSKLLLDCLGLKKFSFVSYKYVSYGDDDRFTILNP